jgi:hypothetical protein
LCSNTVSFSYTGIGTSTIYLTWSRSRWPEWRRVGPGQARQTYEMQEGDLEIRPID